MKINKKSKKLILIAILGIITLLLCGAGYYWYSQTQNAPTKPSENSDSSQTINFDPPTTEQKQAGEAQKTNTNTTTASNISVSITAANASSEVVQIRAVITGAISNSGTCQLILSKSGDTITKTASTYALPASSTCQGFDINRSELSTGSWTINLSVLIDDKTASATSEVILE